MASLLLERERSAPAAASVASPPADATAPRAPSALCRWALECTMQVLEFFVGQGPLRKQMADRWDPKCELPAAHVASCNYSFNLARKAAAQLEYERRAKPPERSLAGTLCVSMLAASSLPSHDSVSHDAAARPCQISLSHTPCPDACGTRGPTPHSTRTTRTTAAASHSPLGSSTRRWASMLSAVLGEPQCQPPLPPGVGAWLARGGGAAL